MLESSQKKSEDQERFKHPDSFEGSPTFHQIEKKSLKVSLKQFSSVSVSVGHVEHHYIWLMTTILIGLKFSALRFFFDIWVSMLLEIIIYGSFFCWVKYPPASCDAKSMENFFVSQLGNNVRKYNFCDSFCKNGKCSPFLSYRGEVKREKRKKQGSLPYDQMGF